MPNEEDLSSSLSENRPDGDPQIPDEILENIPDCAKEAVGYPEGAMGAFLAVILDGYIEVRERELEYIEEHLGVEVFDDANIIAEELDELPLSLHRPIGLLALPMLRTLSKEDYLKLRRTAAALIRSEAKSDAALEYEIFDQVVHSLDLSFGLNTASGGEYSSAAEIARQLRQAGSCLAYAGGSDPAGAFEIFGRRLGLDDAILPEEEISETAFGAALDEIARAVPSLRERVLGALHGCAVSNGGSGEKGAKLLAAAAAALHTLLPDWDGESVLRGEDEDV
ncbi:MAG: hypothetical protein IJG60_02210 [Thermoguttaceae bacterium]|nr:hypothetical protein [Thermoguttaceae bacterium]